MNASKLQVKVFIDGDVPHADRFIPVFHDWIKHHKLPELLIDVANYAHVPKGPGVALIGNDGDYFIDDADGKAGLLYSRKREAPAPEGRLADAFRRVLNAAALLEKAFDGKLRFRTDEVVFRINDRLKAPAGETTFAELRPELEAFCTKLFGAHKLALAGGAKQLFSVRITTDGKSDLATLLGKAGGPL